MTKQNLPSRRSASHGAAACLSLLLVTASCAFAQENPDSVRLHDAAPAQSPWLVGASIGVPGYGSEPFLSMFTIAGHWTQVNAGRLGADFWVATVPWGFTRGAIGLAGRGGVAFPIAASSHVLLLPSGGVSVAGAAGHGGAGATAGFNAGVAAVVRGAGRTGLRTSVTWHRFGALGGTLWLLEVGVTRGAPRR